MKSRQLRKRCKVHSFIHLQCNQHLLNFCLPGQEKGCWEERTLDPLQEEPEPGGHLKRPTQIVALVGRVKDKHKKEMGERESARAQTHRRKKNQTAPSTNQLSSFPPPFQVGDPASFRGGRRGKREGGFCRALWEKTRASPHLKATRCSKRTAGAARPAAASSPSEWPCPPPSRGLGRRSGGKGGGGTGGNRSVAPVRLGTRPLPRRALPPPASALTRRARLRCSSRGRRLAPGMDATNSPRRGGGRRQTSEPRFEAGKTLPGGQ